mgnify:CR=1 FL=1
MIEMAQGTLPGFISTLRAAASGGCAPKRACGRSRTHPSFPSKESPPLFDKLPGDPEGVSWFFYEEGSVSSSRDSWETVWVRR